MSNVRISEIANELGYPSKEIVEKAQELGLKVKTHSNAVSLEEAEAIYEYVQTGVIPDKFKKKKSLLKKKKNLKPSLKRQLLRLSQNQKRQKLSLKKRFKFQKKNLKMSLKKKSL